MAFAGFCGPLRLGKWELIKAFTNLRCAALEASPTRIDNLSRNILSKIASYGRLIKICNFQSLGKKVCISLSLCIWHKMKLFYDVHGIDGGQQIH